ncbi:uncharacterized protein N7518_001164 [Penicillium psychrosexuale]|uniref:uncharacterized protein n=1 Tax=Penicillium psychrosexuale TaxID=1002107 RepID=UPI0025453E15|nr:uncharacterized protein N7518_001164 [Penicillium psychrosexuale]KAJ5799096.1 hypothetical protein N7518_001164 [Penicillium psychrosexuale]
MPYSDILVTLLDILELATCPTFSESDIVCLGVIVKHFLPGDEDFLNSNTKCLFKPISKENLKPWKISASEAAEIQSKLNIPDLHCTPKPRSNWDISVAHSNISVATGRVFDFIMAQFRFRRQGETPLKGTFGWNEIDYEDFYGGNGGFLFSTSGRYKGVDTPAWRTCLLEEWWNGEVLAGPSLRLVLCTDEFGKKGCLLLSELGAIAQLITFRRTQSEFQTFQLFPVLLISLFGPRHGRII